MASVCLTAALVDLIIYLITVLRFSTRSNDIAHITDLYTQERA